MPYITEQEAMTKRCPLTMIAMRAAVETMPAALPPPDGSVCVGTQCMAWLWMGPPPADPSTRQGCCGLAPARIEQ